MADQYQQTPVLIASIMYILHTWLTCRALSVTGDASHPSHSLFSLLPSGKSIRSLQARCQTASASEQAVRMPDSAHCPSTLTFDTIRSALHLHYSHLFWMRDTTFWFFFLVIQRIDNKKKSLNNVRDAHKMHQSWVHHHNSKTCCSGVHSFQLKTQSTQIPIYSTHTVASIQQHVYAWTNMSGKMQFHANF